MDVGINYRDLVVTGRLQALARKLGVSEQEALGRFVISCFETQDRELVEVTSESYASAVGLRIDDPEAMLKALEASQLASRTESGWLLRGNEKHVQRLQAYRTNAKNGGIARSKQAAAKRDPSGSTLEPKRLASGSQAEPKSNPSGTQGRASGLATEAEKTEIVTGPKRQPSGTQAASNGRDVGTQAGPKRLDVGTQARAVPEPPSSKFRALDTGILDTGDQDHDLQISDPSSPRVQTSEISDPRAEGAKSAPPARVGGLSATARIRSAYLRGYEQRFGRPFVGWGLKSNGQAAHLQRDWPADRIVELIELFFAWNNPRAIAAGFPFSFFVTAIHELDADTHSPERKRQARVLDAAEHQIGRKDAEQLTLEAELAQIRARRARAATHNETLTKGLQPVKQAVKQVFAASAPQLTRGGVDELVG